jgi:hypothetical protein
MKYKNIEEVNLEEQKLTKNIAIAVTEKTHIQWTDLKEFYRSKDINIAENLRQTIQRELNELEKAREIDQF